MNFIGIDLHKDSSQVCILTGDGELFERRTKTDKANFRKLLADRPPARVLVEASAESEWAARYLEALGHEVIVADPNFAPMYATRDKRIKTDKRDARTLCEACRLSAYRSAHRTSERQRDVRAHLIVRDTLVRSRSKYISLINALSRREGFRLKRGPSPSFASRVAWAELPAHMRAQIESLLLLLEMLNEQIKKADHHLAGIVKEIR
jgi:transposase